MLDLEEEEKRTVHAHVSVPKPLNAGFITIPDIPDGSKHHLSVEVACQLRDKLGLDGQLLVQQAEP